MSDIIAGRYVLEAEISAGGMAAVWQARDNVLARPVAVKILHPHLSQDGAFLERFRREALAAARLSHPNIVAIYDTGSEPGPGGGDDADLQYIVMELCHGGTLGDILASEGALPPSRVAGIGSTICDALAFAHREGIVHRDVKPANVLVAGDGLLKVADFGIAKAAFANKQLTTTGSILGTVTYLSPEQGQGLEPDHRSDIYGLGVVLYELLVGRPPFAAPTQIATALAHVKEPPPRLRSIKAGIPRSLEAVVMKALEKQPEDRFTSADEMGHALRSAVGDPGSTVALSHAARAPVQQPRAARASGDMGWVLRVVLAIAVVVGGALVVSALLDREQPERRDERNRPSSSSGQHSAALEVAEVSDFDPHGGDGEHPEEAPAAADGDSSTSWTTQTYSSGLATIGKPGVGLLFDLGAEVEVKTIKLMGSPGMDLDVRASDSPGSDETDFDTVASRASTAAQEELSFTPTTSRYWLVWITALTPQGGGTASIAEVEFRGS